jgi:hypothetical protein
MTISASEQQQRAVRIHQPLSCSLEIQNITHVMLVLGVCHPLHARHDKK